VGGVETTSCAFSIHVRRDLGAIIVTVLGELDAFGAARLEAELGDLIDGQGNMTVVVDLRRTASVDPAGLGALAAAAELVGRRAGQLTLSGASDEVFDAMNAHLPASMMTRRHVADADGAARPHDHIVEFYESDELLAKSVRDYVQPSLRGGDAVVVVATKRHRDLFEAALTGTGIDVGEAREEDRYIDLDAEETLSLFMLDGTPDPIRFEIALTKLLARAGGGGRSVSVYGEMVAFLWDQGNITGVIALEDLWNELGRSQQFSLFCAYPLAAFDRPESAESFRTIREQHSGAHPQRIER
jgi:anti-anti-sigma factor